MKNRVLLFIIILLTILFCGCEDTQSEQSNEKKAKMPVMISVQRTGNIVSGIGDLSVYIDDEQVFQVNNNKTESVKINVEEGVHTIQTKGQGDKSKKIEFEVVKNGDNEFFFTTEISMWLGVDLEERKYIPIN